MVMGKTSTGLGGISSPSSSLGGMSTPSNSLGGSGKTSNSLGGISTPSSSLGSFSTPSSDMQVSTPASSAFGNWNLNNMKFFSPDNRASAQPASSIPASDYGSIMQALSQLPSPDQAQQYYGGGTATPTPAPSNNTDTFITNVSSTIPSDQVIFIEVAKNTMLLDPTNQGIIIPNMTMNYKFSDSSKKLVLKRKAGVDYNGSQMYFGYANSDDVNNRYVYDYSIGSSSRREHTGTVLRCRWPGAYQGERRDQRPDARAETRIDHERGQPADRAGRDQLGPRAEGEHRSGRYDINRRGFNALPYMADYTSAASGGATTIRASRPIVPGAAFRRSLSVAFFFIIVLRQVTARPTWLWPL